MSIIVIALLLMWFFEKVKFKDCLREQKQQKCSPVVSEKELNDCITNVVYPYIISKEPSMKEEL